MSIRSVCERSVRCAGGVGAFLLFTVMSGACTKDGGAADSGTTAGASGGPTATGQTHSGGGSSAGSAGSAGAGGADAAALAGSAGSEGLSGAAGDGTGEATAQGAAGVGTAGAGAAGGVSSAGAGGQAPRAGAAGNAAGGATAAGSGGQGAAGALNAGWVGIWDGASQRDDSSSPFPLIVLIDEEDRVFVADAARSVLGWGNIDSRGDILFAVDGKLVNEDDAELSYEGTLQDDAGSGSWESSLETGGVWAVSRREGVELDSACSARCERLARCMVADDTPTELAIGSCLLTCAIPTPTDQVINQRFAACAPLQTCEDLLNCFSAGELETVYVASSGDDENEGTTPEAPKRTLNAAMDEVAVAGTIRVAAGTYVENIVVTKPLTLEGGYDGGFTDRDPEAHRVVLDGGEVDRVITVVVPAMESASLVLEGVSLVNGRAIDSGGGLAVSGLNVHLSDCIVEGNHARGNGGGIAVNDAAVTLTRCLFTQNTSEGNAGGGLDANRTTLTLTDSTFTRNTGGDYGGGANLWQSASIVTGCLFTGNSARINGGGIAFGTSADDNHALGDSELSGNTPNGTSGPFDDLGGNTLQGL